MPITPPDLTQRLIVTYTSVGIEHELLVRPPGVQSEPTLTAMANAIATELSPFMLNTDAFVKADYCAVSSSVRFPLVFAPVAGLQSPAGNVFGEDPESVQLSVTGKCLSSGIRWSSRWFSPYNFGSQPWPAKNRWQVATAPTGVQNFWTVYQTWYQGGGLAGLNLVGAGTQNVILNNYVNATHNGYWERKQRTS